MTMSRKQEIYQDILRWALPSARNTLSRYRRVHPIMLLSPRRQRYLNAQYEIAEFVHNIYFSILDEEFLDHDIHFLNYQARNFYVRNNDNCCDSYSIFVHYIQELFKAVPEDKKNKLVWSGPKGDYSWARPRYGWEMDF